MIDLAHHTFAGTFPFAAHYREVHGFPMHFVDEGAGEPIVFVHGTATWRRRSSAPRTTRSV